MQLQKLSVRIVKHFGSDVVGLAAKPREQFIRKLALVAGTSDMEAYEVVEKVQKLMNRWGI